MKALLEGQERGLDAYWIRVGFASRSAYVSSAMLLPFVSAHMKHNSVLNSLSVFYPSYHGDGIEFPCQQQKGYGSSCFGFPQIEGHLGIAYAPTFGPKPLAFSLAGLID